MAGVSPARAASACSRLSLDEISTAARSAPSSAMPAPTRNASWKPSVSEISGLRSPEAIASLVVAVATAARTARPSAPPICCEVLMRPEASPASSGLIPVTAAIVVGTNASPSPIAASSDGNRMSPT